MILTEEAEKKTLYRRLSAILLIVPYVLAPILLRAQAVRKSLEASAPAQ